MLLDATGGDDDGLALGQGVLYLVPGHRLEVVQPTELGWGVVLAHGVGLWS